MAKYIHKQNRNLAGERLVGGEPAHRILEIVHSFPLSVNYTGGVAIEITAVGIDRDMFERAYAWIEMEFLAHEAKCRFKASHATVDAAQYRLMILNELVFWAKYALEDFREEALWAPVARARLLGPIPLRPTLPGPCAAHGQNDRT